MVREPATPVAIKGILLETIKVFSDEQANAGVTEIPLIGEVVLMGPAPRPQKIPPLLAVQHLPLLRYQLPPWLT